MIFYDMASKVVDTESFPQQNIAGDISGITFVLFSQKPLQWKEINTHTHTSNKYEWITQSDQDTQQKLVTVATIQSS